MNYRSAFVCVSSCMVSIYSFRVNQKKGRGKRCSEETTVNCRGGEIDEDSFWGTGDVSVGNRSNGTF